MDKTIACKENEGVSVLKTKTCLEFYSRFYVKELRLIIEVDGESHESEDQWYKDKERQRELEDYGLTVLRFLDDEIFNDLENVSRVIEH